MTTVFLLLLVFQLKHWLCDYPLQRPWMLGKFLPGWRWVPPLAAHAAVHGLFTLGIAYAFGSHCAWLLALLDAGAHFAMDRVKASPNLMGRWKPLTAKEYLKVTGWLRDFEGFSSRDEYRQSTIVRERAENRKKLRDNRMFWHSIGIDQMVHHLTHYLLIWLLVR